jgi:hypothetical protein
VPAANLTAMFNAVAANAHTCNTRPYADEVARDGRLARRPDQRRREHPADVLARLAAGENPTVR